MKGKVLKPFFVLDSIAIAGGVLEGLLLRFDKKGNLFEDIRLRMHML